ncbi:MAG: hypothetical protein KKF30_06500 [Proteobacteria bacterium]|nr:hypothetical protein [Pseudomonadota bacterium]MBU4470214.1 hypothetical protein [Pseudomonadota bacterium]MCG2752630.1 hypothetical protein [Desulfobacteraceae bacterium]
MKTNKFVFLFWMILVVFAVITGTAWAEDVDMTGTWKVVVGTGSDGGAGTPTFVLKQEGKVLTGTYKGQLGESPVNGTMEGNNFKRTFKEGGSSRHYKGKVEGTQMSGEASVAGLYTMQFTGEKESGLMP